jgi:hypothetical protein
MEYQLDSMLADLSALKAEIPNNSPATKRLLYSLEISLTELKEKLRHKKNKTNR